MYNLLGLSLDAALSKLNGDYEVKLIEMQSPRRKYDYNKRVVRHRIIAGESGMHIEISYAGFPVLGDKSYK